MTKQCDCNNSVDRYKEDQDIFINYFAQALENNSAALFAGAGISVPSGGISWAELLRNDADKIGIDVDKETDLISVAQYIYNETGTRQTISQLLKNKIMTSGKLNLNHDIIKDLSLKSVWTTNYDQYLEEAFKSVHKVVDVKYSVRDMTNEIENADVTIYKMHGDIAYPHEAVILKDDYEIYDKKNEIFSQKLQSDLLTNTFLFIGFSFDDPNLEKILSRVRVLTEDNTRLHYCILKEISNDDKEFERIENEKEKFEAVKYRRNRQRLRIKDLKRYGIKAVVIKDWDDLPRLLSKVKQKYLSNRIFISGAYHKVDEFLGKTGDEANKLAKEFVQSLSNKLYEENFKITIGLGLGLGMDVVSGALKNVLEKNNYKFDDRLMVRPFPQHVEDENERNEVWNKYRKTIMKDSGISLFLFGNKSEGGKIIKSKGMKEEYKIATEYNQFKLPIASTGYMANDIWNSEYENGKITNHFLNADELIEKINGLSKITDSEKLVTAVIDILLLYRRDPGILKGRVND